MLNKNNITALKMKRQYLTIKANQTEYNALFRDMSPVHTIYWTAPGDPPSMYARSDFDDLEYNYNRRANREIVKGRFQNGGVGYVEADELELFACLYKKEIERLSPLQFKLVDLLEHEGPLNIKGIKEITGLLVKEISPELHKLQEAFIVYEDQVDNDGDRGWYIFEREFEDVNLMKYSKLEALKIVLQRFAKLNVAFDENMAKSYYGLPMGEIKTAIDELTDSGIILKTEYGYMRTEDHDLLENEDLELPNSVYLLHRNDFLVKSNEHSLKAKYKKDVLHYILVDGEFKGAVYGRFKFGPPVIERVESEVNVDEFVKQFYNL